MAGVSTLTYPGIRDSLLRRIDTLRPDSQRRWGRMNAHQAVCHLNDSFKGIIGVRPASPAITVAGRTLLRFVALHTPLPWPKGGVPTRPEVDQEKGGTPPGDFATDVAELKALIGRFGASPRDFEFHPHPAFGQLTESEWMRWAYRHVDHHLKQFGA
jgi:hypothetical protein